MVPREETVHLLALVRAHGGQWHRIATLVESAGTARGIVKGEVRPPNEFARRVQESVTSRHVDEAAKEVDTWSHRPNMKVWTVLDDEYPSSLRTIYNRPPFLFCRGRWKDDPDASGLAVVGTRKATRAGLLHARRMAEGLAQRGVTVISGLALGIDGAAHLATLDASGRTIAVLGSGLDQVYPRKHTRLADQIVESGGALISQFVPNHPPTRITFPLRNALMSGLGRGTIVIEAGAYSGAKMQARLALEHGRTVFFLASQVDQNPWAREYIKQGYRGGYPIVVESVDDALKALDPSADVHWQPNLLLSSL